jgi:hypothetical protein
MAKDPIVFKICEHCNKEFKLTLTESYVPGMGLLSTDQDCPHCGKHNDIWIRLGIPMENNNG